MITDDNFTILIPARKGSKGLPFKNRKLFKYTADIIPDKLIKDTYISTDDDFFKPLSLQYGFNFHKRDPEHAKDESTSKEFVLDFLSKSKDYLITLYLTYPERTWSDVELAISFFNNKNSQSLLCKKEISVSPYLMMYELDNSKGEQVIRHNLCRRQDYRPCFEISHFISIINKKYAYNLNNNLYNKKTDFMLINDVVDIDKEADLERFNEKG